jgi:hypothetical protein
MVFASFIPIMIVIVVAAILLLVWTVVKNRSSADAALTDQVRRFAEHDVTALTEQIRRVGALPEAEPELAHARECERRANDALAGARHPADVQAATAAVAEGFYAVQCAQAAVEGHEPPEQRRPCYFDPSHGLSVMDVDWAPSGEPPAHVPACQACAAAVAHRAEPTARTVNIAGMSMPHWQAPDHFDPWAAGFYGPA